MSASLEGLKRGITNLISPSIWQIQQQNHVLGWRFPFCRVESTESAFTLAIGLNKMVVKCPGFCS